MAGVNLSFSETMIIQDDAFKGDPDDEDYEGFTGNEGAHATHFYRPTVSLSAEITSVSVFHVSHYDRAF